MHFLNVILAPSFAYSSLSYWIIISLFYIPNRDYFISSNFIDNNFLKCMFIKKAIPLTFIDFPRLYLWYLFHVFSLISPSAFVAMCC